VTYLEFVGHGDRSRRARKSASTEDHAPADDRWPLFRSLSKRRRTRPIAMAHCRPQNEAGLCEQVGAVAPNLGRASKARRDPDASAHPRHRAFAAMASATAMAFSSAAASRVSVRPRRGASLRGWLCFENAAKKLLTCDRHRRVGSSGPRGPVMTRGRQPGGVVTTAKIWTDDGRRRAADLMGLTREVRVMRQTSRLLPNSSRRHVSKFFLYEF